MKKIYKMKRMNQWKGRKEGHTEDKNKEKSLTYHKEMKEKEAT